MYTAPGTWWGEAPVFAFFDFLRYNFVLASLKKKKLFIWLHLALVVVNGVKFPDQGLSPGPLHWQRAESYATGPSGTPLALPPHGDCCTCCWENSAPS